MTAPTFDITPEKEASYAAYFHRQLFVTPKPVQANAVDLRDKTAIITGSSSGIGLEAARQLLDLGLSRLILAVRDAARGEAARENLSKGRNSDEAKFIIEVWILHLSSYSSIIAFAERAKSLPRLDIAIMNAGVFKVEEEFHPETGFEQDVQINYLSTVLLGTLLLPTLQTHTAAPARLVFVSSDDASRAPFPERLAPSILSSFKDKMQKWNYFQRYATSKLLGQLFLTELAKRVPASDIIINCVNPGFCHGSELGREGKSRVFLYHVYRAVTRVLGRSCSVGARSITHAAVSWGEEIHGQYVEDSKLRPKAAIIYKKEGEEASRKLWNETLAELSFAGVEGIIGSFETKGSQ